MEYRCVNAACGRAFPRAVKFCPYCGSAQAGVAARPVESVATPAPAPATPQPPAPAPAPAPRPPAPARPGSTSPPRYQQPQPAAGVPRPPGSAPGAGPARPPLKKPVGMGTWIAVALLLLAIWYLVKPKDAAHALADRVDDAVKLTESCSLDAARAELAALRSLRATAAQLERVQKAIAAQVPSCERKNARTKAWADARAGVESALAAGQFDKAASRLAAFVKKYGDDGDTERWRDRIAARRAEKLLDDANACLGRKDRACAEAKLDAAAKLNRSESEPRLKALREELSTLLESTLLEGKVPSYPPPLSATPPRVLSTADADEARRLEVEAERELAQGNYRAATGRAAQCAQLGATACNALRDKAARLDREFQACMKAGRDWVGERCE